MAIDPNKMQAFATSGPAPDGEDMEMLGDADMEEGGDGHFGALIPLLEANVDDLEACCDELNPEALLNLGEDLMDEDRDILIENFGALPEDIKAEMLATLGGVSGEEADKLATHLESEGMLEDGARFAALLQHIGRLIEAGDLGADEDAEDAGEDDEDLEEEETEDDIAAF